MAILFITHDLGIVRAHGRRRRGDDSRAAIVETGADGADFRRAAAPIYAKCCSPPNPRAPPPPPMPDAPKCWRRGGPARLVSDQEGLLAARPSYVKAVDGVSLVLRKGQTLGVVGESGSGKTTLGLALLRLIRSQGPILYLGQNIDGFSTRQMRPLRTRSADRLPGSLWLAVAAHVGGGNRRGGPADPGQGPVGGCSGAKRSRRLRPTPASIRRRWTAIRTNFPAASASASPSPAPWRSIREVIVLDEPTSALDRSVQAQIVDLLRDLQVRRGLSYLFISHDLKVVKALASQIA